MTGKSDCEKLDRYNEHIIKLENLLRSVDLSGTYEEFRLTPCLMLFNFIDLLRSVSILDNYHMVVSGKIIIRSMFEILIDFLYCETDRKNLYQRFGEYQDVNRVLLYNSLTEELQSKVNRDDYNNITLPNYERFRTNYNIQSKKQLNNWSGLSLYNRVKSVSEIVPEIMDIYFNIYKVNCGYAHTYADTLCEYTSLNNRRLNLSYEKKYKKDEFILINSIDSLANILYENFRTSYYEKKLEDINF